MQFSPTEIAAWWGAALATLVLAWDVVKHVRSGPRLRVRANPNMEIMGSEVELGLMETALPKGTKLIHVDVTNVGDQPTTLTHFVFFAYRSRAHRLFRRALGQGVSLANVGPIPMGNDVPHLLAPGARWSNMMKQNQFVEMFGPQGVVYVGVAQAGVRGYALTPVNFSTFELDARPDEQTSAA